MANYSREDMKEQATGEVGAIVTLLVSVVGVVVSFAVDLKKNNSDLHKLESLELQLSSIKSDRFWWIHKDRKERVSQLETEIESLRKKM